MTGLKSTQVDTSSEWYRGWKIVYKIRSDNETGKLKAAAYVYEKLVVWPFTRGSHSYKEVGEEWVDEDGIEQQLADISTGAKYFIDNVESAKDISRSPPYTEV